MFKGLFIFFDSMTPQKEGILRLFSSKVAKSLAQDQKVRKYKLKRCYKKLKRYSKKECCKQCRHLKFKGTRTKWPVQTQTHRTT